MIHFLAIQNSYTTVDIALFKGACLLQEIREDKMHASKNSAANIDLLLKKHQLNFDDLSFIAVNQGPGPFTTLRTIIATANGLSFASGIPLIGIDGLEALMAQGTDTNYSHTVALLNAFNKDVYFNIPNIGSRDFKKGYAPIDLILKQVKDDLAFTTVRFIGNGASLYQEKIHDLFGNQAYIDTRFDTCTIAQIGVMALERWLNTDRLEKQLMPLYLKQAVVY